MTKIIALVVLTTSVIAATASTQAEDAHHDRIRSHRLVPVVYDAHYAHWLICADRAGICGVTTA